MGWLRRSGADADRSDGFSGSVQEPLAFPFGRIKDTVDGRKSLPGPNSDGESDALLPLPAATLRTIRAPYTDLSISSLEASDAVDPLTP